MLSSKLLLKILLIIWFLAIWIASSLPAETLPKLDTFNLDKLIHMAVYLILSTLIFLNYKAGLFGLLSKREILMIASLLACLDEAHQVFISNRSVSVLDLSANLAGLIIGYYIIKSGKRRND